MLLFIYIIIAPLFIQGWIYAMFCISLLSIFALEYMYPQWVVPYETKEKQFIDYAIALMYVTFFTSFTIWIFRKSYDREQKIIRLQKEELERMYIQTNEKNQHIDSLIKELHHRVKNNLQVMSSLMALQSNRMKDAEGRQAMEEGRTRINAMALIHQELYLKNELAAANMNEYLENLSGSLAESFGYPSSVVSTQVTLHVNDLDIDQAVSIGLIVNELATNSFKHAFNGVADPRLFVRLNKLENELELEVSDNGNGINPGEFSTHTFGMKLVNTLVQQLRRTIHFENRNGAKINIKMKAGL